ncbi:hypothetical protein SEA_CHEETO1_9 [Microbacterium phage Cheeto1]|nr:hypothetical protein SEA_CHEETO1_9 [Microbacterium phage Cheeto1]
MSTEDCGCDDKVVEPTLVPAVSQEEYFSGDFNTEGEAVEETGEPEQIEPEQAEA